MKYKTPVFILLAAFILSIASCEAVGGIFKAGMGFGIILVLIVLVLIIFVVIRLRRRK